MEEFFKDIEADGNQVIEEVAKALDKTNVFVAIGVLQSTLLSACRQLLKEQNNEIGRSTVRLTIKNIQYRLKKDFGQTLFDEEAD